MPSSLSWLDHDPEARDRSLRILAMFQERRMPDELGLGAIRDAFSDRMFPGTSTIQTRLRYMLFVPWVYRELERRRTPSSEFPRKARDMELRLIQPLCANEDNAGVFGKEAGRALKRLPSMVYWSGLHSWGIRIVPWSQDEYFQRVERFLASAARPQEDLDEGWAGPRPTLWHPALPDAPDGFPDRLDLALTRCEAEFLRDGVVHHHPDSLLAHLFLSPDDADGDAPWLHPGLATFPVDHRELLDQARRFSGVMYGAAILYNRLLAELDDRGDLADFLQAALDEWRQSSEVTDIGGWNLESLWLLTANQGHDITWPTRAFVTAWTNRVRETHGDVLGDPTARMLVQNREMAVKGRPRSRFQNARARSQWGGAACGSWTQNTPSDREARVHPHGTPQLPGVRGTRHLPQP